MYKTMYKTALVLCCLLFTGVGMLRAQDARATLTKLDAQRLKAISDGNIKAVAALLASDYMHVNSAGRVMTRSDYLVGELPTHPRKSYRPPNTKLSIRQYGDMAIMIGPQFNELGSGGKPREFTVTLVWRKTSDGWKQVSAHYSPIPQPSNRN